MEKLKMYKEMEIKPNEFDAAMMRLGYSKTVTDDFTIYNHQPTGSKIYLSQYHKALGIINKGWFIANSSNMQNMGVLDHYDDLAKMIEQMRLESLSSVA